MGNRELQLWRSSLHRDAVNRKVDTEEKLARTERKSVDWSAISSAVSATAAVLALIVTLIVASQSNAAVRDAAASAERAARESALRAKRAEAYADYVRVHARFHEHLWAHLYHAGTDTGVDPEEDPAFFPESIQLIGELESTNLRARILAHGTSVDDILLAMRDGENEVFRKFKCMAGLTCSGTQIEPATNDEIEVMLDTWSRSTTEHKKTLITDAGAQLQ